MPTNSTLGAAAVQAEDRQLVVNGEAVMARAATLAELLEEMGFGGAKVATALNGDFVPAAKRAGTAIAHGDRVEIVSARQGG